MFEVTDRAKTALHDLLRASAVPDYTTVRIAPDGAGGLTMHADTPRTDDLAIRRAVTPMLVMNKQVAGLLNSHVLDGREGDGSAPGAEFTPQSRGRA